MKSACLISACALVCLVSLRGQAQSVADLLRRGFAVRHAVIPLYNEPDRTLSALVRIDKSGVDYQRKGFFSIGILPFQVLEGVTFELEDGASAAASLERVRRWFGPESRVELRHVKFVFQTNTLEAARVRFGAGPQWQLLDGVRSVCGGTETRAARATFQVSNGQDGQVILETAPRSTTTFLFRSLTSTHKSTATSTPASHEDNNDCCNLDDRAKPGDGAVALQSRNK